MTRIELIVRYTAFALVAMVLNLAAQRAVLAGVDVWGGFWLGLGYFFALCVGTGVGLIVKYSLDKRWIFFDRSAGLRNHSRKFSLYTGMGVFTTLLFWGSETAFWLIWESDVMREVGAAMGLTVGYVTKYQLDKRFVFDADEKALARS